LQKEFDEAFIHSKPLHTEYLKRLREWRDKYEVVMTSKPRIQSLDSLSHYLTEFQYNKVDEIEVPGQYAEVTFNFLYQNGRLIGYTGERQ
jgi:transformation/transcription domain-associated protein